MDPELSGAEAPGDALGRSGSFDLGLNESSVRQNALVPRGFHQMSVLQQPLPSGNGMAAGDYQRVLPGTAGGRPIVLPSKNGTSANTWDQNTFMRLNGRNVI